MGKIAKRVYEKHGAWYFVDRGNKWHRLCKITEGEAAMFAALAKVMAAPPEGSMPSAIAAFKIAKLKSLSLSASKEYSRLLDIAADDFEAFDVPDVRPADVKKSVEHHYPDAATAARAYKARLSTFFRWAVGKGLRDDNPCTEVWLDAPDKRDRYITHEEYHAIRERLHPMAQVFIDLCYLTAQRSTDIRVMRWNQLTPEGLAFRPTKTAKSSGAKILVPVSPAIQECLDSAKLHGRIKPLPNSTGYVIQQADGSLYTMSGLRSAWQRACKDAGIKGATIKDLRPKALTDAKKAGMSLEDLQDAAAHASITTTEGYIKQREVRVSRLALPLPKIRQGH